VKPDITGFVETGRHVALITTVDSKRVALRLATSMVESRLAACAQVWPIVSVYRWKGRMCRSSEYIVLAKTSARRARSLAAAIRREHPYELPQIVALPIVGGLAQYLEWLDCETGTGSHAGKPGKA
jgi:periplasmic divalent cation tolerance protein